MNIIINISKSLLLISVTMIFISSSCNKDSTRPCSSYTPYSFKITSEWLLQQELYHIGDTLILTSTFPKILTDYSTLNLHQVDYSNAVSIASGAIFYSLDSVQHQYIGGVSKFNLFSIYGSILPSTVTPQEHTDLIFQEQANNFFLKIGIIAKEKGIFALYISNGGSEGIIGKNCTNAAFDMTVTNSDKHVGLFQFAMQQTPDVEQQRKIYCFRVQ